MQDINEIVAKLNVIIDQLKVITEDHEERIRNMEGKLTSFTSGISLITFLLGVGLTVLNLVKH